MEIELIVRMYHVIEMKLFVQNPHDHLQKDLWKQNKKWIIIIIDTREFNLLKHFAWIGPRCPWQWTRNNPKSFKCKRGKHSPDIWIIRGRSTRIENGEPIEKEIVLFYFILINKHTFNWLISTWNMNWIKTRFLWNKIYLNKIIIKNCCCCWNLTSTKKNNYSYLSSRCWFRMN